MISSSLWLLLLLAAVSCVHCVELTQTESAVLSPGQVLTLSCKISGYSVTDSSYCSGFNRQPAGKALEWIGFICGDGSTYYSDKLKSRFQVTRESSSNTEYVSAAVPRNRQLQKVTVNTERQGVKNGFSSFKLCCETNHDLFIFSVASGSDILY
ncbi:hypothetical protein Q8A67_000811 [Cirrhinus molitorella]|uniref:Immunoglobulin V-set domain-containing protein n=1 Tax=Cirrhinus molitorella TaxID=172907 RepID=A0AA88Q855_9TELE|nr:hypothetical protein Q8A67_000811 [Cirrhinus molitorella]